MKYKIINSDLLINGKLIPENSEVELSAEDTKGIEDFLQKSLSGEASTEAKTDMTEDSSTINEQTKSKRGKK